MPMAIRNKKTWTAATMKLSEAMKEQMLLSFEVFPPKTDKGMERPSGN